MKWHFSQFNTVGDSPRGPLQQLGNPHLKPTTKPKYTLPNRAGYGPRSRDLNDPPRRPARRSPRAGFASLEGARLPRAGSVPFEGVLFPRAGSASLEGPLPLEQGPPRSRAPRTHTPAPVHWAFNALTPAGQCHHAPGARAPVPPHQLPRREPIPIAVGKGLCSAAGVSPVTPCACSSTANVPSPRRGAGFTLDSLSCDPTGLGGGTRREDRHPCHCYGMAAAPVRAGA
jgi:hypothetical protein